jgi:dTDP-4-dehydrorhamnose reductase
MKILLLGKNGQVGWELQRTLAPLGEVLALDRHGKTLADMPWTVPGAAGKEVHGDLTKPEQIVDTILRLQPDVVVNAAAYTAVDKAESEPTLARLVNAQAPAAMARACDQVDALLVHYSTDYIFDGSGAKPYREDDKPSPTSVYGQTKLEGEQAVRAFAHKHLILRTAWVFGSHGGNFLKTDLRLSQERSSLRVVNDQIGTPTSASYIAETTASVIAQLVAENRYESLFSKSLRELDYGTYHLACAGRTSWFNYAVYVVQTAKLLGMGGTLRAENIEPIPSAAYPTAAARPAMSVLNAAKLQKTFGIWSDMWDLEVSKVLLQLRAQHEAEKAVLQ